MWWRIGVGLVVALATTWLLLVVSLIVVRPKRLPAEALRMLPDLLRLLRRLAADDTLPRGVRVRLVLVVCYLALPIDLIPDFVPVIGYADDAILVSLVLRDTARRAGLGALRRHWPGTDDGFEALRRLCGIGNSHDATERGSPPRTDG